jgi:uncharacterized protein (TIGR02391 family)
MINLQANIDERLWTAIEKPYQSGNYSGAVVDAIHFITQLIREKTGLDNDGQELAGRAFGGPNPVLKVNSLQTESERNEQKGAQQLLMGLYQGIRNPRSHVKYSDSVEDADSIVLFINFLSRMIDKAKPPFETNAYLQRVFDPFFVESDQYAELLVAEIPANKRWDILIETYRRKESGIGPKLAYFMRALLSKVTQEEIDNFCAVVSEELRLADNIVTIRCVIQVMPTDHWLKYAEVARIRAENMVIDDIKRGKCNTQTGKCMAGGNATWAANILHLFITKAYVMQALRTKLSSSDRAEQEYVFRFFDLSLSALEPKPSPWTVDVITKGLKAGDKRFYQLVGRLGNPVFGDAEWLDPFRPAFDAFEERPPWQSVGGITDDDVPF